MTKSEGHHVVQHPEFGFFQVIPTPSPEEITRFYAEEFYSSKYKAFNNSALEVQETDQAFHDGHREDIAQQIRHLLERELSELSVLDIGCGWGQTLKYLADRGAACAGFDPAQEAVAYVQSCGIESVCAGMERMDVFGDRRFDVVMLMNVLEHLADPVQVIQEIKRTVLRPDGLLIIEVPNDFNDFQKAARELHGLQEWWVAPPAHLNYFSSYSLSAVLKGCGFDVRELEASFPLELFLLMGDNYVADRQTGRLCHEKRMAFERNLRDLGKTSVLRSFYKALADVNLGRQVIAYAMNARMQT
jgi:2-polyprenyl-3-methyl-5-hydroxy-6-metoxy-1,4-benzoquinol methylase